MLRVEMDAHTAPLARGPCGHKAIAGGDRARLDRGSAPVYGSSARVLFSPPPGSSHCGRRTQMAEKKAKTAEKSGEAARKHLCPKCGAESRIVQFAGFGPRGIFWVCEKDCGYSERTR